MPTPTPHPLPFEGTNREVAGVESSWKNSIQVCIFFQVFQEVFCGSEQCVYSGVSLHLTVCEAPQHLAGSCQAASYLGLEVRAAGSSPAGL